jgi:hypothetical protein
MLLLEPSAREELGRMAVRRLDAARESGDEIELAKALGSMANMAFMAGRQEEAAAQVDEALAVARRAANPTVTCLMNLGAAIVRASSEPEMALQSCRQAVEAADSVNNIAGSTLGRAMAAWVHIQRDDWASAAPLLVTAIDSYRHYGIDNFALDVYIGLAAVVIEASGDDEAAASLFPPAPSLQLWGLTDASEYIKEAARRVRKKLGDERYERCATATSQLGRHDLTALVIEHLSAC